MKAVIEVQDLAVRRWLTKLEQVAGDLRPALVEIGDALVASTKLRFRDSRAPGGAQWAPLSPVTIALRRGGGAGAKPLLDTARLMRSITRRIDARAVVVGTNTVYGRMQHFGALRGAFGRTKHGAPVPWGNVPGRPFLGVSGEDRGGILRILRERLQEAAQ